MIFGGAFLLFLSLPLRLINNWFKKQELEQALKTLQLEAELRFLKAQVNPHFLFNALNNIYALSFTESKQAPSMILKLSEMMSYMLYDCKSELVPLQSEIAYLHNVLALQQLKKEGEMQVEFHVSKDIQPQQITPMLFIPFFENAFKHGNLEDIKNGWLKAQLYEERGKIHFSISNSYLERDPKEVAKGGVGLTNIRQRLTLLYPNKHSLTMRQTQGVFTAQLQLELSS
jgi:LytS/YehU family sensor histidine kinase